jgi:hypothetical protein
MNYRPMFTFASGERLGNAQVFATREEAQSSAEDRFRVWTMPTGYDVDETADAVTYQWTRSGGSVRIMLESV